MKIVCPVRQAQLCIVRSWFHWGIFEFRLPNLSSAGLGAKVQNSQVRFHSFFVGRQYFYAPSWLGNQNSN